jgi:hypothetical protein
MQTRQTPFSGGALIAAAAAAPGLSIVFGFGTLGIVALFAGGAQTLDPLAVMAGGILLIVVMTVWGLPPALIFGGGGAWLAGRFLPVRLVWAWGVAGMAAAAVYCLVSILLASAAPGAAFWLAPWTVVFAGSLFDGGRQMFTMPDEPMAYVIPAAILSAGAISGLIYRAVLMRSRSVSRTRSAPAAEPEVRGLSPIGPPRHEEG